ncbi:hypothetical protein H7J07_05225 [Mycobacterium koreense]|uniref:Sensor domain-containing protein n=1 Tax=Mycolicibacillus koreensis TaxID=1069220 RepID=A0AA91PCV6_9MYCO|nr:hypothetical protein [Mycolicibacillus koreensis]MCV7247626.1 hypothetical protein [Mycolicibacillus koreensis]OSC32799.1 hypothetical protein B8W67_13680 [Mycolicibacillus koreensis]
MKKRLLAAAAAAAIALGAAPSAAADPFGPPEPAPPVFDVSALPIPSANWQPIVHYDRVMDFYPGMGACSWGGVPVDTDLDPRVQSTSPVYVADLRPAGFGGDTQGWFGTVSAARFASVDDASYALSAYRRYLDACPTAPENPAGYHNDAVGTSALDPTLAHALIETDINWVEVFAAATDKGLVELALIHPKDGPVEFQYNPAAITNALKTADVDALTDAGVQL